MGLLFIWLLIGCAYTYAQYPPLRIGKGKKMTPEEFRKIPDEPMLEPVDDIPPVPYNAKPGDSPLSLGLIPQSKIPRDQYLEEDKMNSKLNTTKKEEPMLFNFQAMHDKLIVEQSRQEPYTRKPWRQQGYTAHVPAESDKMYKDKFADIEPHGFGLISQNILRNAKFPKPIVWSTCEDLKRGSSIFNPEDIVNILWIPFYTWSDWMHTTAVVHKFTIPTQRQVYEYKNNLGPYLNRTIDWTQPKLFFDRDLGSSTALLIAADKTGLYYLIFDMDVPEYVQRHKIILPLMVVRLKIVGNYLALMYCDQLYTLIMARDGVVPPTNKEKRETAKILNFRGKGRPVVRDKEREQLQKENEESRKNYLKAIKYLPSEPGVGYLDALTPKPVPMRRRNQNNMERLSIIPDRVPN